MPASGLKYRADIDGLRAVAVLSVLLFHVDARLAPGGFTGVDVFFVISGYLITSIIQGQHEAGRFRFSEFYRRRILRIAPAYLAVTCATLLAGAVLMVPQDFSALARSALWSAFSAPNIYFWLHQDTSYFASDAAQIPLLHLWSLGVEEQFYLIWPALLLLSNRVFGTRWFLWPLSGLALASFVAAQHWASTDFMFAYYMLPARAGELLVGGLLALALGRHGHRLPPGQAWRNGLALMGYALIGYGIVGLDEESHFPGFNTLYPCLGAASLILAGSGGGGWALRPLTWRPMVWVGLISYSLYLWHWPVLAMARYFLTVIGPIEAAISVSAIFALAWASYRFVELPFRAQHAGWKGHWSAVLGRYGVVTLVLAAGAWGVFRLGGLSNAPWNAGYRAETARMEERMRPAFEYDFICQSPGFNTADFYDERCILRPQGNSAVTSARVLLAGDSNAAHYVGMLAEIGQAYGFAFRNIAVSSCPPLASEREDYGSLRARAACTRFRHTLMREAAAYPLVVLGAQWTSYSAVPGFREDLRATLSALVRKGRKVVLLGVVPRFPGFGRSCELRRLRMPWVDCKRHTDASATPASINAYLRQLAESMPGVTYMDALPVICPAGVCSAYLDGKPLYFDPGHLSMVGSREVGRAMVSQPAAIAAAFKQVRAAARSEARRAGILPDGFLLPFEHTIREDRLVKLGDGRWQRQIEFDVVGMDANVAKEAVTGIFARDGFRVTGPWEAKGGIRTTYKHKDGRWVTYIAWSTPRPGARSDATGSGYFGWIVPPP